MRRQALPCQLDGDKEGTMSAQVDAHVMNGSESWARKQWSEGTMTKSSVRARHVKPRRHTELLQKTCSGRQQCG
jgi:predicted anti-sigma-YlaC factor YlaD